MKAILVGGDWDGRELDGVSEPPPLTICATPPLDSMTEQPAWVPTLYYRLRAGDNDPAIYDYGGSS